MLWPCAAEPALNPDGSLDGHMAGRQGWPGALVLPRPGLSGIHPGHGASAWTGGTPTGRPSPLPGGSAGRGKIAGLFQGRLEAGPRALGSRSILASPLIPGVAQRLDAAVKFREPFRPFAPVVLADRAADYFRLTQPSPYMSIAAPVTELARRGVPAVVHANGPA